MATGTLIVIAGPMFAGKTDLLITMASALQESDRRVYYPNIDTRYEAGHVTAHNGRKILAEPTSLDLESVVPCQNIFIDEAQFLTPRDIVSERIRSLIRDGSNVTLSGLDLDSYENPIGLMGEFMVRANKTLKVTGICAQCSAPSTRTHRKVAVKDPVLLGGSAEYEPRCLTCFYKDLQVA